MPKNEAAVALARKRWAGLSAEERQRQTAAARAAVAPDSLRANLAEARAVLAEKRRKRRKKSKSGH